MGPGTACVDTDVHPLHCGDCGDACNSDQVCINGDCRRFEPALLCDSCAACASCGDGDPCCTYPGGASPICIRSDDTCPVGFF